MNLRDVLTKEEFTAVTEKNDWLGARIVLFDWLAISGTFFLAAAYPNPLVLLLAVMVLGARQLGFGVVVHETGHRTLFKSPKVNDFVGKWLSGYFIFSDKESYMRVHLKHHQDAGSGDDPDLSNYVSYPITRSSLKRKVTRDITGQVGWRRIKSIARAFRHLPKQSAETRRFLVRSTGANLLLLGVLTATGYAWLYLLWLVAFMTSHMLVSRIRQIAEHAAVPDLFDKDPRKHTRTLYANWLERLFIAPHHVNYHLEHHLMASVPIYRLKQLHELLLAKGFYEGVEFERGYLSLLRRVTSAAEESAAVAG